jgi:large conductance mechanosensitive channel
MISGFREFILRGNVVELAVAVVIGAAFGVLITSFVTDVLTPLLGIVGVPNFEELTATVGSAEVRYGRFLNALVAFLLIAAALSTLLERVQGGDHEEVDRGREESPTTKACTECASEIPSAARRCPMCTQPQPGSAPG